MRNTFCALLTMTLAACGGSGGGDDAPRTAKLNLAIVDAPVDDAAEVWVQFSGIEMQGPDGRISETFTPAKKINLLAQTGGNSAPLLSNFELTAGRYEWIRLQVDLDGALDTYLVDKNGLSHELDIPSGAQTGLKLNSGFTLAQGGAANFTIDFDLRRSVIRHARGYRLKPTLRLIDNIGVGNVTGTVSQALVDAHCTNNETGVIYLYRNGIVPVVPDDIGGSGDQPLTTTNVILTNENTYHFEFGFVESGLYTVAWTCDAVEDNPEQNDQVIFNAQKDVQVQASQSSHVDL